MSEISIPAGCDAIATDKLTLGRATDASPQSPLGLALFDLDHTLIPFDSDYRWGEFTTSLGWTDEDDFKLKNQVFYEHYKAGTLDIRAYVRFATAAVRRHGREAAQLAHQQFMRDIVMPEIRPEALDLVRQHQSRGDIALIITATNEFVTRPIARAFGVSDLLAIELETDRSLGGSGWYTGEICGVPSFQQGKVARLESWMAHHGLDWSNVYATFYSDSMNDLPLLEKVQVPVATNPDDRLRAIAQARGWRILELFATR